MKRVWMASAMAAVVMGTTGGCATAKETASDVNRAAADVLLPIEEETKLGTEMKKEIEKDLTLIDDSDAGKYVKTLGVKIVRAAKDKGEVPEGIKFRFHTVKDDKTVNAFAIPGGDIYVYTGLLKRADNAAEVISVLGHEVAHVTRRHIAKRLVAQYGLQAIVGLALGEDPGLLGELASQIAIGGALLKHSRDDEQDADYVGIPYTIAAGYDPHAFLSFFEKLKSDGDTQLLSFLSSHPMPAERIANALSKINSLNQGVPTKLGEDEHQAIKAGL